MSNKSILYVPGKNPKPPATQHHCMLLKTMLEGVRRADLEAAKSMERNHELLKLIAWNSLYYYGEKDTSRDLPWIDELLNKHGPSQQDIDEATHWHRTLDRMLYNIADYFPFIINFLPKALRATVIETNRYFFNHNNIACEIRELLKAQLRPLLANNDRVLLIGHSLGSVIAYDTLWELSHEEQLDGKVDLFLTIGSPLGMNFVQHRLAGHNEKNAKRYPACIRRWANVSSVGDITALDRVFKDDFGDMLKYGLIESIEDHCEGIFNYFHDENGLNCHRSYGYLVNPAVGKVIADWWSGID